ncbi:MAG: single-stranded-DNA-specific exonuclease RecJ [Phycisphaerae bacterium]|nr:single-stranded-DNA-specific exonuclease RecJ [Phycisphaerae bacterium]
MESYPADVKGLTKRWRLPGATPEGMELRDRILQARGLTDPEAIEAFLSPDLHEVTEPAPLAGIEEAARILADSLEAHRPIVIYGDYDVDGITATSILWHVMKTIDPEAPVSSYVPHRLEEGYGLNPEAIRSLAEDGARTIISVDCGITAVEEAALARELGLELIITDHHRARDDGRLPDAAAIVHPGLPGQEHDFPELAGAGVAWKVALHLARHVSGSSDVGASLRNILMDGLCLAAMGTIADVMPLYGENRVIAHYGLRHMEGCRNTGVQSLLDVSGTGSGKQDAQVVGFRMGPRLNAAGRMGHARDAIELFTTADGPRADELARTLSSLNRKRQEVERSILEQAKEMAVEQGMTEPGRHAIVLRHPDWHPGVVGIVCSRLVELYGRPTILMQDDGGQCRGSARSINGYSIHGALAHCEEHIVTYGGHDMAAGMTVESNCFDDFAEAIISHASEHIAPQDLMPELKIDTEIMRLEITNSAIMQLTELRPFGRGNPAPRVLLRDMTIIHAVPFGKTSDHLKLKLKDEAGAAPPLEAIWWGQAERCDALRSRQVNVVGKLEIDDYSRRPCLVVDDLACEGGV